jgi:hypothetical protein
MEALFRRDENMGLHEVSATFMPMAKSSKWINLKLNKTQVIMMAGRRNIWEEGRDFQPKWASQK